MQSSTHSRSEGWRAAGALALVMLLLVPGLARASVPGGEEAEARARQHFAEGTVAYDLGEFGKALRAYSEAYRLAARPALLFNVAQCHRQLGQHERAAFFYRRFLFLAGPDASDAALARELLAEVEARAPGKGPRYASSSPEVSVPAKPPAVVKAAAREPAGDRPEKAPVEARPPEKREAHAAARTDEARAVDERTARMLQPPPALTPAVKAEGEGLTRKWWLWAGVGAAALLAGGVVYAATAPSARPTTLGNVPGR